MSDASAAAGDKKEKRWLPLESNPELLNSYIKSLGVKNTHEFYDVFGMDEELLMMVPQPCVAVLLLFPITANSEAAKKKEQETLEAKNYTAPKDVYYIKQTIGNACGTIGLVHTIMNLADQLELDEQKFFAKFLETTKDMSPEERAKALEASEDLEKSHQEVASSEQNACAVDEKADVDLHFIAFVNVKDTLYELDGRKASPIPHGATSADTFLSDAVKVVKQFAARDPEDLRFNMAAFSKAC
jgi:ubiquitin carboxyl-terminal hydrolase L3